MLPLLMCPWKLPAHVGSMAEASLFAGLRRVCSLEALLFDRQIS